MLAALPTVTVALCDDGAPLPPRGREPFSPVQSRWRCNSANWPGKKRAEVAAPELLRRDLRHAAAPGLAAVTELLETGLPPLDAPADEVRLFAAASREEEARAPQAPSAA